MKVDNPHIKELQNAIREGDKNKEFELNNKNRHFVTQYLLNLKDPIKAIKIQNDKHKETQNTIFDSIK